MILNCNNEGVDLYMSGVIKHAHYHIQLLDNMFEVETYMFHKTHNQKGKPFIDFVFWNS